MSAPETESKNDGKAGISSKNSGKETLKSAIVYTVLGVSMILAVANRQYSVINYESIIHEFDPWFNYRSTQYMVEHGFYKFLDWFDRLSWYPLGRIVGTTVYPGLMYTSGFFHYLLQFIKLPVHIREICVFLAPAFSTLTVLIMYFFTKEIWDEGAGIIAGCMISIIPGYISRSVAGSYDNEGLAIFLLILTFYLWLKALRLGSVYWGVTCALAYCYMVTAWGGYVFIINMIPMHVLVLLIMGKYSGRLYVAYCSFFILGLILAMQTPFVGFLAISTSEHIGSLGVFGLLQIVAFANFVKNRSSSGFYSVFIKLFVLSIFVASIIFLCFLASSGYVRALSGRFYSLFDTGYAKIHLPIISSVSEHQPTSWTSYISDLHFAACMMFHGLYLCVRNFNESRVFAILYILFASYFSGVMVRLIQTLTPIVVSCCAISVSSLLRKYFVLEKTIKAAKGKKNARLMGIIINAIVFFIGVCFMHFVLHSTNTTRYAYSGPSVVLSNQRPDGSLYIIDDFREAYYWLNQNTHVDAKIMSWWDYGYQITGMANRTTIVDNNTWNNTHIALVGRAMASNETEAYKILRRLEVDYVLVIFGGMIGYSGDDINKFLWMVRISQGEFPQHISEPDYFSEQGAYTVGSDVSETMKNSMMYKMCYHDFGAMRV